ncbi:BZ3500_MvSof-1268-A1-R1_Chr9g10342 [Microbotryum saponariae]|uniref:BZ3500_MvSof-1268-A1-R1_Chr9g10342 protein n=1 Tax=Microbotryum saponariae TaxID=289078 RepID=A0A2X0LLN2_9BASI|nr:BZ3501_MvSof-1269-A2-R1_Chr9g10092 [Microbotryum saponariae]SCZ99933.1 BZ3500_MvSof-1268-A1-R1_Chr9g10342 [Microbotryum saponariae]
MLFKASAALVLTLLSITTSASSKKAAALEPQAMPTGPSGITIHPVDHQNYSAGHALSLNYQGFQRFSLETATIDVVLKTANGLNEVVFATDLGAVNRAGLFSAAFVLPELYHMLPEEKDKPLLANVHILEREKQFLGNGSFKFQTRYQSQAPSILINNAKYFIHTKKSS